MTTMELAYRHGWKLTGNRPSVYGWHHPELGTLRRSGPASVDAPWVWRPAAGHEYHFATMREALIGIHGPEEPGKEEG